ncbi:acyl-CoA dehydrogenase family protein [Albimonas pacifica]|uniref:Cyclohexane-1-carbonyl-CoA dehydrogenase n=1 Tax=Albimonas pacifica TaxID=1114924 RepID=A0A1I3EKG3_9RHOB|nr:acyl-CoA dehydrogenase family protein [Albimonas pacifica]SFH99466.1 acyl-CoA dehydrogenase [Albimonas pacifica]
MANAGVDDDIFEALLETVERFVRERLIPAEPTVEENDEIPADIVAEMKAMGLFGISIGEEYGGLGLSTMQEARLIEALCNASLVFRSLIGTTVGIGSQGIVMDGTEAQKREWLPKLATGEAISAFALTEPDYGSDASRIKTSARREGDDFIINGTKRYITNAPYASVFTLMARSNPEISGARGISAFIVPADTPGITVAKPDKKMGQRGAKTADVIFENVRVPAASIVGGPENEGKGFVTAMKVLDRGRVHISAMATGTSQRMLNEATDYAMDRKTMEKPIAEHQLVQAMLADCQTEIYAMRSLAHMAAKLYDEKGAAPMEAACAKYFTTEAAGRIADRCVQIFGGAGYMAEYAIERLYRDVRLLRIYEGTSQIQQTTIAKGLVKRRAEQR